MEVVAATSAVVGVVGFGLQIYGVLIDFASKIAQADQCVQALIIDIKLTTSALENIQKLLENEKDIRKKKQGRRLFSDDAVADIKRTADHCSDVFMSIVSIINKNSKSGKSGKTKETMYLKEDVWLSLDEKALLTRLQSVNWALVQDKIKLQTTRLQDLKVSLILLFSSVQLTHKSNEVLISATDTTPLSFGELIELRKGQENARKRWLLLKATMLQQNASVPEPPIAANAAEPLSSQPTPPNIKEVSKPPADQPNSVDRQPTIPLYADKAVATESPTALVPSARSPSIKSKVPGADASAPGVKLLPSAETSSSTNIPNPDTSFVELPRLRSLFFSTLFRGYLKRRELDETIEIMDLEAYLVKGHDITTIHYSKTQLGDLYRQIGGQTPREGVHLLASLTIEERRVVEDTCRRSMGRVGHLVALQVLDTNLNRCLRLMLRIFNLDALNQGFSNSRKLIILVNKPPQIQEQPLSAHIQPSPPPRDSFMPNLYVPEASEHHAPTARQFHQVAHPVAHRYVHPEDRVMSESSLANLNYLPLSGKEPRGRRQGGNKWGPEEEGRVGRRRKRDRKMGKRRRSFRRNEDPMEPTDLQERARKESLSGFYTSVGGSILGDDDESESERAKRHIVRLFARWVPAEPEAPPPEAEPARSEAGDARLDPGNASVEPENVPSESGKSPVEDVNVPDDPVD